MGASRIVVGDGTREGAIDKLKSRLQSRGIAGDQSAVYQVIRHYFAPGALGQVKIYEASGDHLFISEYQIGNAAYIKVGGARNPWIRLRQGDTIKRSFSRIYIRYSDDANLTSSPFLTPVVMYASHGPLIERPVSASYGLKRNALALRNAVATTTPTLFLEAAMAGFGASARYAKTTGKAGGFLIVKNTNTAAAILLVGYFAGGSLDMAFPLDPGQSLTFNLDDQIFSATDGLKIAAAVGTCTFAAFINPWEADLTGRDLGINSDGLQQDLEG